MNVYCQNCGTKIACVDSKPNFCQKCGAPTSSASHAPTVDGEKEIVEHEAEESKSDYVGIPNIDALDVEITPFQKNKITFGELAEQTPRGGAEDSTAGNMNPPDRKSKKEVQADFKREAGTSRKHL